VLAHFTGARLSALLEPAIPKALQDVLSPASGGYYRSIDEAVWVLVVMAAVTLLSLHALGGYRPLVQQSRGRVLFSTIVSPFVGLSTVVLVLFAFRSQNWSRVFVFLYAGLSAIFLCAYRVGLQWYWRKRYASGVYARNVVLIGPPPALEWL